MPAIYDILTAAQRNGHGGLAWREKMIHPVPDAEVVNRREFILERCKDKTVLDIGCASGDLFGEIAKVAFKAYGIDKDETPFPTTEVCDIECEGSNWQNARMEWKSADIIIAGELLEHLSNPGFFLDTTSQCFPDAELIITTPNAFSDGARGQMAKGIECVNVDHVGWYSWHTLKVLVERSGYEVKENYWYNGRKRFAEGLVFVCKTL